MASYEMLSFLSSLVSSPPDTTGDLTPTTKTSSDTTAETATATVTTATATATVIASEGEEEATR